MRKFTRYLYLPVILLGSGYNTAYRSQDGSCLGLPALFTDDNNSILILATLVMIGLTRFACIVSIPCMHPVYHHRYRNSASGATLIRYLVTIQ